MAISMVGSLTSSSHQLRLLASYDSQEPPIFDCSSFLQSPLNNDIVFQINHCYNRIFIYLFVCLVYSFPSPAQQALRVGNNIT